MKTINYNFKESGGFLKLLILFGVFLVAAQKQTWAQTKILANEVTYTSGNKPLSTTPTVKNPDNALVDDDNYARLLASPGVVATLGSYKGVIELKFAQTLPADTWSYVRMEGESDLFRALLGGSLGNALGTVLGAVLVGNQEIIIDARMGNTSVLSRSSTLGFGIDRVKLMQDGNGNNFLAIRPESDYDRLRITNQIGSLIGVGNETTLDVYSAFYYEDTGNDCDRPIATSFDGGGGIGLEVGDLNDQNLGNAIDDDENSFSRLKSSSVLNVNVASTLSQYFYFPTVSAETTTANIKLALGSGGLVNTDLLGAIEIIFFEDNTIVSRRSLQSSLLNNTNAVTLLDSGDPVTLTFAPGKAFDRIAIKLNSPVGVNLLGNGVKIYDVQRYDDAAGCANPEIAALPPATDDPFETASCASGLIDFENVDFTPRAVDGNNESYATLFADAGNLLVSGPTAGFIEMDLGQTVPANKTTYVRINYDEDVLDRLVGGSLGKLVGDLANSLLLGNQYFEVEAKNEDTNVLTATSSDGFEGTSNGAVTLVQDNIGRYYIAITPDQAYNRVRITNNVVALLSTGKKASLDVYNACFEIGIDPCFPANFTSYRGGGIGLSAGNISSVGVTNAYGAISENSSDYSEINLGVAGLAAHVYQTIYFSQPSQPNDKVKIRLALEPSSALSLDVLGRYRIKFFNGNTQVGNDETLESGLINNLDLLALFGSGGMVELEYEPNGIFDRVEIGAESIASVNVAAEPLRLYSVERYGDTCPLTKTPFPFEVPSCSTTLVDAHNADNVQNLFDDDFDSYATLKSGAGILFGLGNQYEGYVEMGYDQPMSAGTTSYIRIDFEETILDGLVGGSLGNVVSGLLDNLILGDHFFRVDVKDANSNIIHTASSNAASAGGDGTIRVVQDAAGRYYIAVTPTSDYQSVRITDTTNSVLGLLAQPNTMNVYGMCTDMVTDPCFGPFATSYEHSGLSLSVNDLGGAGVTNMSYAINGNTTNYSEISNGTLGIGASTKQWIYFNSVSNENDIARIQFKTQGGVVDADLLGGLEIKAYLANNEVYSLTSQNGLINGINVADLLTNNEMVTLDISPGQRFDRISVGIKTLVQASVFPPIHLYSVDRLCNLFVKDDINQTPQNVQVNGNVLTNDLGQNLAVSSLDYYDVQGNLQTLELNNASASATVYTEGPNPVKAGEVSINTDGSYLFTPENGFNGNVPLAYTMSDGDNVGRAKLDIKVLPIVPFNQPHAPIAQNDVVTTVLNTELSNNVLFNDNDPKSEAITATVFGQDANTNPVGSSIVVAGVSNVGTPVSNAGTFTLAEDGSYSFVPSPGFVGTVNPINYNIQNEQNEIDSAQVKIQVLAETENITILNDDAKIGKKGDVLNGNVLANDFDPEGNNQTLTSIIVNGVEYTVDPNSPRTVEIPGKGTLEVNSNGDFTWTPVPGYVGTLDLIYKACDNGLPQACDDATLYLTNLEIPCTVPGAPGTPGITHIGISTLDRNVEEWLTDENQNKLGAYIALESTNKAFVITRNADPANNITSPVEGMVVWDTTDNCLKLYKGDTLGWECTTNQCNQ
ncbi:cadherin-like domain-containing protein [Weeksellaceae bacterium KMM 9724]|uniref:Ig-like domain-containing protein n=1 Tax=Profundicola chukchiensis TaxID=2961959 RepID=UPI00243BF8AE|nr:Ig-like domain-containing protein [Profundicola chukchiensis]MDG4949606.1 cadherin-like domain-containing protein [Profundicola chukchiensis]